MKLKSVIISVLIIYSLNSYSQVNNKSISKDDIKQKIREYYKNTPKVEIYKSHLPRKADPVEANKLKKGFDKFIKDNNIIIGKSQTYLQKSIPKSQLIQAGDNIRMPGEYEESQAVAIAWPFNCYDDGGSMMYSYDKGYGYDLYYNYKKIALAVPDIDKYSPYAELWSKLADAIQAECTVLIRIPNLSDSTEIINYMKENKRPLYNYKFFSQEFYGNEYWIRDYAPWGYYSNQDSIGLLDVGYYNGRPVDDDIYMSIAKLLNLPFKLSPVEIEGGNFMCDGNGNGFISSSLFASNADNQGHGQDFKNPMDSTQVVNSLKSDLNLTNLNVLNRLSCDGGTGHIDLYLKMLDDQTIIRTDYPIVYDNPQFSDFSTVSNNISNLSKLLDYYNDNFDFQTMPLPTDNYGVYDPRCNILFNDARTYINGLTINKTYIVPIYSDSDNGNSAQDKLAIERLKSLMPGHKIVPIDSRALSANGGEIHCITMQIPTDNPILIRHKKPKGIQPNQYKIIAEITNKSGIKRAVVHWRIYNASYWNDLQMKLQNDGTYLAVLNFANMPNIENIRVFDKADYYITAESNNGKTYTNPNAAPSEFYQVSTILSSVEEFDENIKFTYYNDKSFDNLNFKLENSDNIYSINQLTIYDLMGNLLQNIDFKYNTDNSIPISTLPIGSYYLNVKTNSNSKTFKFNVIR